MTWSNTVKIIPMPLLSSTGCNSVSGGQGYMEKLAREAEAAKEAEEADALTGDDDSTGGC